MSSIFLVSAQSNPTIQFSNGDVAVITFGHLTINCRYWVQWGEQQWNFEIVGVEQASDESIVNDAQLVELICRALGQIPPGGIVVKRNAVTIAEIPPGRR